LFFANRLWRRQPPASGLNESEKVDVLRFMINNCFTSRWRYVLKTDYIEQKGNPLQMNFLLEMCINARLHVEDALLKSLAPGWSGAFAATTFTSRGIR